MIASRTLNTDQCFVHLHVPRTGGTTLRHLLLEKFLEQISPDQVFLVDIGPEFGCRHGSFADFVALSPLERRQLRFVAGHVPIDIIELVPNPFSFAILREPIDRALSDYWYCFHAAENPAHAKARELSPLEFISGGWGQSRNGEARFLSGVFFGGPTPPDPLLYRRAKQSLDRVAYIGIFEELPIVLNDLCELAGLTTIEHAAHLNAAPRVYDVSPTDRALIAENNSVDAALYADAQLRFAARMQTGTVSTTA